MAEKKSSITTKVVCTYCNAETRADRLFCTHCGAPIPGELKEEERPQPPPQPRDMKKIKPVRKSVPFPKELGPPLGFSITGIIACWAPILGGIPSLVAFILSLWTLAKMPRKLFSILALFLSLAGIALNVYFTLRFL